MMLNYWKQSVLIGRGGFKIFALVVGGPTLFLFAALVVATIAESKSESLNRGYELTAKMVSYSNKKNKGEVHYCGRVCQTKFSLWVTCNGTCPEMRLYKYPEGENEYLTESYFYFTSEQPELIVHYYSNLMIRSVLLHLRIKERELSKDLMATKDFEIANIFETRANTIVQAVKFNGDLEAKASYSIRCQRDTTCSPHCFYTSNEVVCTNDNKILCKMAPKDGCNYVGGQFAVRFYLTGYEVKSEEPPSTAIETKIYATLMESGSSQQLLLHTKKRTLHNVIENDDRNYFDFYTEMSKLVYPNSTIEFKLETTPSNISVSSNTKTARLSFDPKTGTLPWNVTEAVEHNNITVLLSGYLEIKCQNGFSGQYCLDTCNSTNCNAVDPWNCTQFRKRGPSCAYEILCANVTCSNGGNCTIKRHSRDNYTAQCTCTLGFGGSRCELFNGTLCSNTSCFKRGNCIHRYWPEKYEWSNKCSCFVGYTGLRCEVCVAPRDVSSCQSLVGNYTLLVDLRSITNTHGWLVDNTYCDDGVTRCDTRVTVCVNKHCQIVLEAPDRDNYERTQLQADMRHVYFELNLSSLQRGKLQYNVTVHLEDFDTNAVRRQYLTNTQGNHNENTTKTIDVLEDSLSFEFQPGAALKNLSFMNKRGIGFSALVVLRCARGFTGSGCSRECAEPDLSYSTVLDLDLDSCLRSQTHVCQTGTSVRIGTAETFGLSCYVQNLCAKLACPSGSQCAILKNLTGVYCQPAADACANGQITCNRRGRCVVSISTMEPTCECDPGFGGAFCQYDKWCSSAEWSTTTCQHNSTCEHDLSQNYDRCNCSNTTYFCRTCAVARCSDKVNCKTVLSGDLAACRCSNGSIFNGCFEKRATVINQSKTVLIVVVVVLVAAVIVLACSAGFNCQASSISNGEHKIKWRCPNLVITAKLNNIRLKLKERYKLATTNPK